MDTRTCVRSESTVPIVSDGYGEGQNNVQHDLAYVNKAMENERCEGKSEILSVHTGNMAMFEQGRSMSTSVYAQKNVKSKVKTFYKKQNKEITGYETFLKGKDPHVPSHDEEKTLRLSAICVNITLIINIILVGLKVYSAISSGSSSVMASLIDNAMDVISNIILIAVNFKVKKKEPYGYPHGKSRMEPMGVLMFAIIMLMTAVNLITSNIEEIVEISKTKNHKTKIQVFDLSLFGLTVGLKFTCFLVMRRWKHSMTIQALALDHLNDSLVNAVALIMVFVAKYGKWPYADPIGALLIAFFIIINWSRVIKKHVLEIVGASAKPKWYRQLCWQVVNHVQEVARPAYLRASMTGEHYLLDIGLIVNDGVSVKDATDMSQSLKQALEDREDIVVAIVCLVGAETVPQKPPEEAKIILGVEDEETGTTTAF